MHKLPSQRCHGYSRSCQVLSVCIPVVTVRVVIAIESHTSYSHCPERYFLLSGAILCATILSSIILYHYIPGAMHIIFY